MSLFKKLFKKEEKEGKENYTLNLDIDTRVTIKQMNGFNVVNTYKTTVNQVISGKELMILAPVVDGDIIVLSHTNVYSVEFETKSGLLKNNMKVISYHMENNMPLIKILLLEKTEIIQRRASYRLPISIEFEFDVVEDNSNKILKQDDVLLSTGETVDISTGGLKFLSNEEVEKDTFIKILINSKDIFIVAIASVIQKEAITQTRGYNYSYTCKFENIPDKYIEELSEYIFNKQRELAKKGKVFE